MRTALLVALLLLGAGCLGRSAPTVPAADAADAPGVAPVEPAQRDLPAVFVRDPDAWRVSAAGLREIRFVTNHTIRISSAQLKGAGNEANWILVVPDHAIGNATEPCADLASAARFLDFTTGFDSLSGASLDAGNYTLLVRAKQLKDLTILFNTTQTENVRAMDGSPSAHRVLVLDATVRPEASSPARYAFNKTFQAPRGGVLLGSFYAAWTSFAGYAEARTKLERDGFLCADRTVRLGGLVPVGGPSGVRHTLVAALAPNATAEWSGYFESSTVTDPVFSARGDLLLWS